MADITLQELYMNPDHFQGKNIPQYSFSGIAGGGVGVTAVTGGYGIVSTGGATPDIYLDGSELDIDDGTAWGGTPYLMFVSGSVTERILPSLINLSDFINDSGWTSNAGTVTAVTASSPLASSGGTAPNITFDGTSIPVMGPALLAEDYLLAWDTSVGSLGRKLVSAIPLGEMNNNEGWASGTVESVIGGYGITSDADPTDPTIAFDGSELDIDDGTAWGGTPYVLFVSGSVSERILPSLIPLSDFNNDSGWTSNAGTVTNVSASSPLASSGGTTPNITFNESSIGIKGSALLSTDYLIVMDVVDGILEKKTLATIALSAFNNDEGWGVGTVTSVVGGVGIDSTGGTDPSLSFDGSELSIDDGTAWGGTPYVLFVSGSASERILPSLIPLGDFNNNLGWTTNTGTVTSVTASSPLASSGGTTPNITFNAASIATKGGAVLEDDFMVTIDGVSGALEKKALEFIPLSAFNNDLGGGTSDVSVANQGNDRIITATATTDALNAEAYLNFDGNKFTYGGSIQLGETGGNVVLQHEGRYDCGPSTGNTLYHRIWTIRNSDGTTWTTVSLHDGISIDSSFGTPRTNTKAWWERDPESGRQYWGNAATTYMQLDSGGLDVTGAITATGEITAYA